MSQDDTLYLFLIASMRQSEPRRHFQIARDALSLIKELMLPIPQAGAYEQGCLRRLDELRYYDFAESIFPGVREPRWSLFFPPDECLYYLTRRGHTLRCMFWRQYEHIKRLRALENQTAG